MGKLKKESGITLIALVVTIIVLLILAGVSIFMLTGENGILKRAKEAKEETQRATEDEQRKMAMVEASMNISGMTFQNVPIPAGFAPTRIAGESTVEEGLVITDSQGNEFVWIPCEYSETEASGKENAVLYNTDGGEGDNREEEWKKIQYAYNGGTWYDSQPKAVGEESIKEHHGFYVARYEAGVPKEADFYVSEDMTEDELTYKNYEDKDATDKIKKLAPVSKKGWQAWNYISQTNAEIVAGNMVNNSDVQSYLIDSHAWNTICRLIAKKYGKNKDVTDSTEWGNYFSNITTRYENLRGLWALHKNTPWLAASKYSTGTIPSGVAPRGEDDLETFNFLELSTGMSEDFKAYNIYDLAGNMWEWTTEIGTSIGERPDSSATCIEGMCPTEIVQPRAVMRGGSSNNGMGEQPVVCSYGWNETGKHSLNVGFRVVLYLK